MASRAEKINADNAAIDRLCHICFDEDRSQDVITCPQRGRMPEHWAHKKCQIQWEWAQRKKRVKVVHCSYGGRGCERQLEYLLPRVLRPKTRVQRAADFFKTRPIVQILTIGAVLLAVNAAFGLLAMWFAGLGLAVPLVGKLGFDPDIIALSLIQVTSGVMIGRLFSTMVTELMGVLFPKTTVSLGRDLLARVRCGGFFRLVLESVYCTSSLAKRVVVVDPRKNVLIAGAISAGLLGISVLVNGGGPIVAGAISATSLGFAYWEGGGFRRPLRILFG